MPIHIYIYMYIYIYTLIYIYIHTHIYIHMKTHMGIPSLTPAEELVGRRICQDPVLPEGACLPAVVQGTFGGRAQLTGQAEASFESGSCMW